MFKKLTIRAKINLSLIATCIVILLISNFQNAKNSRDLTENVVNQQVHTMASSYFDAVNTMMLTGTTANRDIYRQKVLQTPGVVDARIIRADKVRELYGVGGPEQSIEDSLDERAMLGEDVVVLSNEEEGRYLTVVKPLIGTADYNGINCLACHQSGEGDILGAVRVTYSLVELDNQVARNLWGAAFVQLIVFVIGFGGIALIFRQVVARRLKRLATTMAEIEENTDLNRRLEIDGDDEIDEVSSALNRMVEKFHDSIQGVSATTQKINSSAEKISSISDATREAVHKQNSGTDLVASAIKKMESSSQEVRDNARNNVGVSQSVTAKAEQSSSIAMDAVNGIQALRSDITRTSEVISNLDEKTQKVGKVLEIISSIAFQTNLLALNAAVEAARAGKSGRGFAVVATEVRTLATRTHESTDEIRAAIEGLQEEARHGVEAMDKACDSADKQAKQVQSVAQALEEIVIHIVEINQLNSQMATSADDQNTLVGAINKNILDIRNIASDSEEDAEQGKTVSDQLVTLSHALNGLVDRFKI